MYPLYFEESYKASKINSSLSILGAQNSPSHQCAGLKEALVQLLRACGVLRIPQAESSGAENLCYGALI